jgi:hypothetical protein
VIEPQVSVIEPQVLEVKAQVWVLHVSKIERQVSEISLGNRE